MHGFIRKAAVTIAACTTLAGIGFAGASGAGASTRPVIKNATTVCGSQCFDLSSELLGPAFIQNATQLGAIGPFQGRKVNLRQGGNFRVNEDFTGAKVGTLGQFCGVTIALNSYACVNYPSWYPVFEADFAPDSNESGFCVGAIAAVEGYKARLEPCGTARTLFVGDLKNADPDSLFYAPWIFAADTSISHPLALTVNSVSTLPANQLYLKRLNLSGSEAVSQQLFNIQTGPFS